MSKIVPFIVASLVTLIAVAGVTAVFGMMMFGMSNASASTQRVLKVSLIAIVAMTLAGTVAALVLMIRGKPWLAAGASGGPFLATLLILLVLTLLGY